MRKRRKSTPRLMPETRRCAIYTRKSTSIGLDQDFNTLDAQREACERYIEGQAHDGWQLIPDHYDDGGFTGANLERPAFERLITDIEAGKIDIVVVYKVDRLSRSLLDFSQVMDRFNQAGAAFVSVTTWRLLRCVPALLPASTVKSIVVIVTRLGRTCLHA